MKEKIILFLLKVETSPSALLNAIDFFLKQTKNTSYQDNFLNVAQV